MRLLPTLWYMCQLAIPGITRRVQARARLTLRHLYSTDAAFILFQLTRRLVLVTGINHPYICSQKQRPAWVGATSTVL